MGGHFYCEAMAWLPDWKWKQQQAQKKGGSKGGKTWQKKPWSGGKTWQKKPWQKSFKGNDPKKTVWIGDIPQGATFKELKELGDQCGECKWAEVYKHKGKNTGAIGFASAAEAAAAISSLNGAMVGNVMISADSWDRKSK